MKYSTPQFSALFAAIISLGTLATSPAVAETLESNGDVTLEKTSLAPTIPSPTYDMLQRFLNNNADESEEVDDSVGNLAQYLDPTKLRLRSRAALVVDEKDGVTVYSRDAESERPIASVTKIMTAMVILDANLPLDEPLEITRDDRDRLRGSHSRLRFGTILTRGDMLYIALAASENRAAAALARTYPGGTDAFIQAMNDKAKSLSMSDTRFKDSTGLNSNNVSTANDLAKMVRAAMDYPMIREMSTSGRDSVTDLRKGRKIAFFNTNYLTRRKQWNIGLSKTGYISDAGHCLVMQTQIADRPMIIVLLDSWGKHSRFGDASRIRNWLTSAEKKIQRLAGA